MREIAVALLLAWSSAAAAEPLEPAQNADCTAAIATAERTGDIPTGLLAAIAQVESGRPDPVNGTVRPWPWTIDAAGDSRFFAAKAEAIAATAALRDEGIASIDVGCLQVNLAHHPAAFASLEEAFDPLANALYAARFLRLLFKESGDWPAAVAAYHSQTYAVGAAYRGKVLAVWTPPGAATPSADSHPWGFNPANWSAAGLRDKSRSWATLDSNSATWRPLAPSARSPGIERVIAVVAECAMETAAQAAPAPTLPLPSPGLARGSPGREWEGADERNCPASPFAKPAALRQLLVGAASRQSGR